MKLVRAEVKKKADDEMWDIRHEYSNVHPNVVITHLWNIIIRYVRTEVVDHILIDLRSSRR